jgi:hypothetical protein
MRWPDVGAQITLRVGDFLVIVGPVDDGLGPGGALFDGREISTMLSTLWWDLSYYYGQEWVDAQCLHIIGAV